jgi:hypothetical protein
MANKRKLKKSILGWRVEMKAIWNKYSPEKQTKRKNINK